MWTLDSVKLGQKISCWTFGCCWQAQEASSTLLFVHWNPLDPGTVNIRLNHKTRRRVIMANSYRRVSGGLVVSWLFSSHKFSYFSHFKDVPTCSRLTRIISESMWLNPVEAVETAEYIEIKWPQASWLFPVWRLIGSCFCHFQINYLNIKSERKTWRWYHWLTLT